jgi:hypothetical protein
VSVRTIKHLQVRAARYDDAQHACVLLADALRTASLPIGDDGRLVVIRHLPLGRIPPGASAAALALHIERVASAMLSSAVIGNCANAAGAGVVVFRSVADAIVAAARVTSREADAWFWPRIVPGWTEHRFAQRWPLLLEAAHRLPAAPLVAALVVREALHHESGEQFLGSLSIADATRWLHAAGWKEWSSGDVSAEARNVVLRHQSIVERWRQRWTAGDVRLVWLTTMLAVNSQPALAGDARLPSRIASSLSRLPGQAASRHTSASPAVADGTADTRWDDLSTLPPRRRDAREPESPMPNVPDVPPPMPVAKPPERLRQPPTQGTSGENHEAIADTTPLDVSAPVEGAFTAAGGLLLIVPMLDRLGFGAFVAANPHLLDVDFPARVLSAIARLARVPTDDPLAAAFARDDDLLVPVLDVDAMPAAARHELATPRLRGASRSSVEMWIAAVRRWSRRHARQGLMNIVRRPARVTISDTHIDVVFSTSQADVRLRRIALDVDPGWVPWLGRVVRFHYSDVHDSSR